MGHENTACKNMTGYLKRRVPFQPHSKKYTTDFTNVHAKLKLNLSPHRRRMEQACKSSEVFYCLTSWKLTRVYPSNIRNLCLYEGMT